MDKLILGSIWKIAFLQLNQKDYLHLEIDVSPLEMRLFRDGTLIHLSMPLDIEGDPTKTKIPLSLPLPLQEWGESFLSCDEKTGILSLEHIGYHDVFDFTRFVRLIEWFIQVADGLRLSH